MKTLTALAALLCAIPALAQSNIRNAELRVQPAADLSRTFASLSADAGPIWIGYSVPAHDPDWNACCHSGWQSPGGCCGRCPLERGNATGESAAAPGRPSVSSGPVELEANDVVVLFRVVDRAVERVRAFSEGCEIDAGGRRVHWLEGVAPGDSAKLLGDLATGDGVAGRGKSPVADGALMALAAHEEPSALDVLIRIARNGEQPDQRSQALFWLAHRAGRQAAGTIADAIENDPDTDVKTRAVFALSQLPSDVGVPKLIAVARANRNPKVRQRAMFWLGQSDDPRALAFFEEILTPRPPRR